MSHRAVTLARMTDDARERATAEQARRSAVMASAARCTATDHDEWTQLRDDHGRPLALACTRCMATVPVPEAEPGVRLVPLPPGWEDGA